MPAQFLLNLFIAFLWMLLKDEDELRISTFHRRISSRNCDYLLNASILWFTILSEKALFYY